MTFRIAAGSVAAALLVAYLGPVVLKLQDVALWVVVVIGVATMLYDLWESLEEKDS